MSQVVRPLLSVRTTVFWYFVFWLRATLFVHLETTSSKLRGQ